MNKLIAIAFLNVLYCALCPEGQFSTDGTDTLPSKCSDCANGSISSDDRTICICDDEYSDWDSSSNTCQC